MQKRDDPRIRDKKHLPMSRLTTSIPLFVVFVIVAIPLWLVILVPLTVLWQGGAFIGRKIFGSGRKRGADGQVETSQELIKQISKKASDTTDRIYDVVVFGSTGFTGKMAAIYLAKRYSGTNVRWAIAGRRADALRAIRTELSQHNKACANLPIILADSFDDKSLSDMCSQTKVVITTAGPFSKYGTKLVRACVLNGTHYCDITGETDWVRRMIDQFDDAAKVSGSRIVHFCGHDCVPWDLAVLECSNALQKNGEQLSTVSFYDEINSGPSGGTLATVFHVLSDRTRLKAALGFDPLVKTMSGEKSTAKFITKTPSVLGYSSEHRCFTTPFVMAMVMANCVRRSNALLNYSPKLTYKEAAVNASFFSAFVSWMGMIVLGTALVFPPFQYLLQKFVLPEPGQGPSEKTMDAGYLHITGYAYGNKGSKVKVQFYFPTDPGYRDTARMLVESGLVLALESDKVKVGGGVWTPAACQGEALRDRLVATGSSLVVE
eukprot:gene27154-32800_t